MMASSVRTRYLCSRARYAYEAGHEGRYASAGMLRFFGFSKFQLAIECPEGAMWGERGSLYWRVVHSTKGQ